MRKVIIDERADEPEVLRQDVASCSTPSSSERRQGAIDYKEYLAAAARRRRQQLGKRESDTDYPTWADNGAKRALVDFGFPSDDVADRGRRSGQAHQAGPLDRQPDEGEEGQATRCARCCPTDFDRLDELFDLVKARDEYR